MNSIFRRGTPILRNVSLSISKPTQQCRFFSHNMVGDDPTRTIVNSLCESLRKGLSWESLSRKYESLTLSDLVSKRVLLELKEPNEAKRALSFFHWSAHDRKITHGLETYCIAIHILVRARLVKDARALMESVLKRNIGDAVDESLKLSVADVFLSTYKRACSSPFVFDILVQTYCELRMFETAFDVCCYLDEHEFSLRLVTYNAFLHSVPKSADTNDLIWKAYGHMIQKRTYPNEFTVRAMTDALCKAGELQSSVNIIDRIHGKRCSPVVIVNTTLVLRMIREGRTDEGLVLLKRMMQKNLIPDTVSYSLAVYAKIRSGELESAREVYEEMLSRGFCPNSFVYTMFIESYCEEGNVEEALNLLEEMVTIGLKPYDETYNSLIIGCANKGNLKESYSLCEEMIEKGFLPCSLVFNEMVRMLCEAGKMKQVNEILTVMMDKGFSPDETTYLYLIDGYGREKNISEVLKIYYEMEFRSLSPGLSIFTLLVTTLCAQRKLEDAEKYLAIMKSRSLRPPASVYESLICAHLGNENKGRAHQLYDEMVKEGLKINLPSGFCLEDLGS